MAAPHPLLGSPIPSASARRSATPAAPKLRDSCDACASSKVKCHREKPACSRCVKRGIKCEYVATRRGGRKHDGRSGINLTANKQASPGAAAVSRNVTHVVSTLGSWYNTGPMGFVSDYLPSPDGLICSPKPLPTSNPTSLFPGLLPHTDDSLSSVLSGDEYNEFDDFFDSHLSFARTDGLQNGTQWNADLLGDAAFFPTSVDSSSNSSGSSSMSGASGLVDPMIEDPTDFNTFVNPPSPPMSREASVPLSESPFQTNDPGCSCLLQAFSLMKQLFPTPTTRTARCATSGLQGLEKSDVHATVDKVISRNKYTVEAVSTMLQCPCSQDGHLLAIMCQIVFKVLGRYAEAAKSSASPIVDMMDRTKDLGSSATAETARRPELSRSRYSSLSEQIRSGGSATVGSCCHLEGEDAARMAAQLVLSELHRVQRLVNQLSNRLKAQATTQHQAVAASQVDSALGEMTISHFSGAILEILGADLRKRLKSLSMEIVDGLRRE